MAVSAVNVIGAPPPIPPSAPAQTTTLTQGQTLPIITLDGDSLTAGAEDINGGSVAKYLSTNYGFVTVNGGIGGQTSTQICARTGGCALTVTFSGNSILTTTTTITAFNGNAIVSMATNGLAVQPLSTTGGNSATYISGTVCGVHGTMGRTASGGPPSTSETYTFQADSLTSSVSCAANSAWTPDTANNFNSPKVLWLGRNNYTQTTQIATDIASSVAALTTPDYLVLDILNGDQPSEYSGTSAYTSITTANNAMLSTYGNHALDVREYLVSQYNAGNILDTFNHTNDVPPASLRAIDFTGALSAAITTTSATSFSYTVTTGQIGAVNIFLIDSEYIECTSITTTGASSCTRGYAGSTAATHLNNAPITAIDFLHLSSQGYQVVASYIMANINKWYPDYGRVTSIVTQGQPLGQLLRDSPCFQGNNFYNSAAFGGQGCNLFGGWGAGSLTQWATPSNSNATGNTFLGSWAGSSVLSGSDNVYVGFRAGASRPGSHSSGSYNIGIGVSSLDQVGSGQNNNCIGAFTCPNVAGAAGNVALGFGALNSDTGNNNIGIGFQGGFKITSGTNNICVGYTACQATLQTGSTNIIIGSAQDALTSSTSNEVNIGGVLFYNTASLAAPAVSSCGTSPTIDSKANNRSGTVTAGTGVLTSCTVTFAGSGYSTWNHCRVTAHSTLASFAYMYGLTAITFTGTSITSAVIDYDCDGV